MLGYQSTINNFLLNLSSHESKYKNLKISKGAFSKARRKISYSIIEKINRAYVHNKKNQQRLWNGLKVFAIDGSKITMPDSQELNEKFGKPSNKNGTKAYLPQATLVTALDVFSNYISEIEIDSYDTSEQELAIKLLPRIEKGSLIINDRLYGSRAMFFKCEENGIYYLSRMKTTGGGLKEVCKFAKSKDATTLIEVEHPEDNIRKIKIRLIKGAADKHGNRIVLATNLFNKKLYHSKELIALYKLRWEIETFFGRIKNLVNIEKFHSKNFNGIMQELYASLLLFNATAKLIKLTYKIKSMVGFKKVSWECALNAVGRNIGSFIVMKLLKNNIVEPLILVMINEVYSSKYNFQGNRHYPRFSKQPQDFWTRSSTRTAAKAIFGLK